MTVRLVKFKASHLENIDLQEAQKDALDNMTDAEKQYMYTSEFAYSILEGEKVLACGGIVKLWEGRAHAWSLISGAIGRNYVALHKIVLRAMNLLDYDRVEMDVLAAHKEAVRWAEMLGFYNETPNGMINYMPDGKLYYKFVRVK